VTDWAPAPPEPDEAGGVVAAAVLEVVAGGLAVVVLVVELLEPHPVATIAVAASATIDSHPFVRAFVVTFLSL